MNKRYKLITTALLVCFLASSIVYGKNNAETTGKLNNTAPNASLSATVVHPKKLDIVLMTDYTGTKKSTLLNDVNSTITKLFNKNVDAQLIVEDSSNTIRTGEAYYGQEYDGSPSTIDEYGGILNGGSSISTGLYTENNSALYKRKLNTEYGTVIWNNNDTLSFSWKKFDDYVNHVGEAPPGGGVLWDGSNGKIKQIGASKHAVYILTTDNKLFMSGNATQMAANLPNSWTRQDTPYTGMRQVFTNVKDIKSNYHGIAALMTDGTVKYAGNVGVVKQYGDYGMMDYEKVMNVETDISSSVFMYSQESFLVTKGFVTLPGMNGITRIQIGQLSVMGLNDNTGQVFGIGYNEGQFGWQDPYFMPWTGPYNYNKYVYLPQQPTSRLIPTLDARKIKDIYMYGVYTKVIEKDNSIWQLKGGGFKSRTYWQYMWAWCDHVFHSIEPGSYKKVGNLASDELFEIDISSQLTRTKGVSETTEYRTYTGYAWVNDQLEHNDFRFGDTTAIVVRKNGTAYYKYYKANGTVSTKEITGYVWNTGYVPSYFNGIVPIQALNTEDVEGKSYRQGSDKLVLYISDNTSTDYLSNAFGGYYPFTGLTQSYLSFLSKNNFGAYVVSPSSMLDYVESKFSKQVISLRQVVNTSQDGHLYDTGNYAQALADILAKYSNNEESLNNYVIVNEDILKYNTQFIDREYDAKKADRWMYNHNPNIFLNDLGIISTNNQWVNNPITKFDKVGEYKITYQVQDDPTLNPNFSEDNLWSNQTEQLKVIAHRRPVAKLTAKIPKEIITPINLVRNFDDKNEIAASYNAYCNIQNNGVGGSKALNGRSAGATNQASATITINVPNGATNAQLEFSLAGSLYNAKLDNVPIETPYSFTNISAMLTPGTHILQLDTSYQKRVSGEWDDIPEIYGNFVLDNMKLTYNTHTWINGSSSDYINGQANITYTNISYDIDHTELSEYKRTVNLYPDKGIQKEEWKWIDITPGTTNTWQLGKLNKYTKNRVYQISFRVQDIEGAWSDPYIIILGDDLPEIVEPNNAPIARFSLNTNNMIPGSINNIIETAPYNDFDVDGDPIVQKEWQILKLDSFGNIISTQNYGSIKPNLSTLLSGNYELRKRVRDDPSARDISLISLWSQQAYIKFIVQDYTVTGQVNHTPLWDANRKKFNIFTSGQDNMPRTYNQFFPGEEFNLAASTNVQALSIRVYIKEYPSFLTDLTNIGGNNWRGEIWDESMLKWKNQPLTFVFTAKYPGSITRSVEVPVQIVDDSYWRLHQTN